MKISVLRAYLIKFNSIVFMLFFFQLFLIARYIENRIVRARL